MSSQATCAVQSDLVKENIKDIRTELPPEENVKQNVESNSRHSGRSVTLNDDVISTMEETSFMDKTKDHQSNVVENMASINNEHAISTDDIINTDSAHDIDEDKSFVNNNSSRAKCLQCMSEVFECTIWFFNSIASSIRARLQNCCACNKKSINIKSREFDDDGEYWNGNVMNNEREEGVITFSFDNNENGKETEKTFYQNELTEVNEDHSKVNNGFEDIDIEAHTVSEHKAVNKTDCRSSNEVEHRNSTTSVVCHVNVHQESNRNTVVCNATNGDNYNSSGNDCGNDGSNVGGNDSGTAGGGDGGGSAD